MSPTKYTGASIVCDAVIVRFVIAATPVMAFPPIVTVPEPLPNVMDEGAKPEMLLSIVAVSEGNSTSAPTASGFLSLNQLPAVSILPSPAAPVQIQGRANIASSPTARRSERLSSV